MENYKIVKKGKAWELYIKEWLWYKRVVWDINFTAIQWYLLKNYNEVIETTALKTCGCQYMLKEDKVKIKYCEHHK